MKTHAPHHFKLLVLSSLTSMCITHIKLEIKVQFIYIRNINTNFLTMSQQAICVLPINTLISSQYAGTFTFQFVQSHVKMILECIYLFKEANYDYFPLLRVHFQPHTLLAQSAFVKFMFTDFPSLLMRSASLAVQDVLWGMCKKDILSYKVKMQYVYL